MASAAAVARKTGPKGTITIPLKDVDNKIKIHPFNIGDHATVCFANQTGAAVTLLIPNGGSVFVPPGGSQDSDIKITIAAGMESNPLSVLDQPTKGHYPYAAYCKAIDGYAEGGSAPVIICP